MQVKILTKGPIISCVIVLLCACSGRSNSTKSTSDSMISSSVSVSDSVQPVEKNSSAVQNSVVSINPAQANVAKSDIKAGQQALLESYPDFITKIENNTVYFKDGSTMVYDDGKTKNFQTLLDDGDIEDMFFVPYDSRITPPPYLYDPGRSRSEALYKKMYGSSSAAVARTLVNVPWFGKSVKFTKVNGAADALKAVAAEIAKYPELRKYIASSGTFYWRTVRGAKRQSAHSYGIAFDIAVPHSDYWQWTNKTNDELKKIQYKNRFPRKIIEIFEKHGFIWGGSWYHYDTMHFEYRPEILRYSELVGQTPAHK